MGNMYAVLIVCTSMKQKWLHIDLCSLYHVISPELHQRNIYRNIEVILRVSHARKLKEVVIIIKMCVSLGRGLAKANNK
eukprot:1504793-Amphidinium_carterae.2